MSGEKALRSKSDRWNEMGTIKTEHASKGSESEKACSSSKLTSSIYKQVYRRRLRRVPPALSSRMVVRRKSNQNRPRKLGKKAREGKNGGPEGVWEVSWAIFPKKMSRRRSWPILAGRGNPKMSGRWRKMAPRWGPHEAKMEPRWPKNEPRWPFGEPRWPKRGPRWPSGGPLGSYLGDFLRSRARSLPRSPKYKIEQPYNVFGGF